MPQKLIVAIDGPAGSGKSTTAKIVAKKLGYLYIDSGAMYRAVTYLAIKKNVLNNDEEIIRLAAESDIELEFSEGKTSVKINGEDYTEFIRSHEVNFYVSHISKLEGVRKVLGEKQKAMGSGETGIVMEGRDIGTAVFPDADVKIFLTASIDKRAVRRAKEYEEKGSEISVDEVKKNLLERDDIDSSRDISPLVKAPDAIEVDTSQVSIDDQVKIILNHIHKKYN